MPKKSDDDWLPDERGRYRRKVGWWKNDSGVVKESPFTFGTNKDQAKARLVRVRELWAEVEKVHQNPSPWDGSLGAFPLPDEIDRKNSQPLWNSESLWIAKQIADGSVEIPVSDMPDIHEQQYARQAQVLAAKYPFINFVPSNLERYDAGRSR